MASPQKENGYTPIANELLEALAKVELSGTQFSLILAIMRKTYGFHKKEDGISIQQFVEMLGVSRRTVIYNLQDLEAKGIVMVRRSKEGDKNNVNIVRFNKDYETWVVHVSAPQVVHKRALGGSAQQRQGVVHSNVKGSAHCVHPQKKTKEITKETSKTPVLQGPQWQELIDGFAPVNPFHEELYRNTTERKALEALVVKFGFEKVSATIAALPEIIVKQYAPKITKPSELKRDLGKLIAYIKQEEHKVTSKQTLITEF